MIQKLRTIKLKHLINNLRDVRLMGMLGFGVIALLVAWSGAAVIQQNYTLQQQVAQLEQEIAIQEIENNNLRMRNEYFETDQYLELQARRQFGLAAPGETMLLVPDEVALRYTTPLPDALEVETAPVSDDRSPLRQNFDAWIDFFFRGLRQDD